MALKNMNAVFLALPTALVILNPEEPDFTVEGVNNAFLHLTESSLKNWVTKPFFETIGKHISAHDEKSNTEIKSTVQTVLSTLKPVETGILKYNTSQAPKILYLQIKCTPVLSGSKDVDSIILAFDNVTGFLSEKEQHGTETPQIKSRKELQNNNENLASQAAHNKAQYESASQELDDFVYSVSHDLRAPLRRIDGFSQELLNEYADKLDESGAHYLNRIRQGAQDMGQLIDDLLKLSRISRKSIDRDEVDLGKIARNVFDELMELESERNVTLVIGENLDIYADRGLIRAMLGNLISNALKFTSKKEAAEIKVGSKIIDGEKVFYISDNGVGFDSAYSHKLFKAFSRLHSHKEFSGTGIGLATVKRIVTLHGGSIWAESPEQNGATFYFKL